MAQPLIVDPPALFRHKHSLLDVANVIRHTDDRLQHGIQFTPVGCDVLFAHQRQCWIDGGQDKAVQDCKPLAIFEAYVAEITVQWPLNDHPDQAKTMVEAAFDVGLSSIIERVLQKGVDDGGNTADLGAFLPINFAGAISSIAVRGHEEGPDANIFDTAALQVGANADENIRLGTVEAKLIDGSDHVGGAGTVYMSPIVLTQLTGDGVCYDDTDGMLYTKATGSKVIVGNFTGDTIYAHPGGVDVHLGPLNSSDGTKHSQNLYVVQVEQTFAVARTPCGLVKSTSA